MGRLHLRLSYDFDKSDLHVHLIEAHDLAGSDQGGFNDPFVKLTLSPEVDNRKRQTHIHRNDPNPFFDQHFRFPVSYDELKEKTLVLQASIKKNFKYANRLTLQSSSKTFHDFIHINYCCHDKEKI